MSSVLTGTHNRLLAVFGVVTGASSLHAGKCWASLKLFSPSKPLIYLPLEVPEPPSGLV